jgi:hypothetical protein
MTDINATNVTRQRGSTGSTIAAFLMFAIGLGLMFMPLAVGGMASQLGIGAAAVIFLIFGVALLALNLLPGIVASCRDHHNKLAIWVTNILMSIALPILTLANPIAILLCVVGWVVALIWACTAVRPVTAR